MIKSLEDVRPGDLFLGPIGGWAGVGVRIGQVFVDGGWKVGPLDVRHIGVVVEASRRLGPGTVRNRETGVYYESPNPGGTRPWRDLPMGDYDTYETGVITAPKLAQAMPGGAEIIEMRQDTHWTSRCAFARIPEDYPGQAEDAAAIARLMSELRIGYSWPSYPALSAYRLGYKAPRLTEWIGRRREPVTLEQLLALGMDRDILFGLRLPVEAICSVFADQAWSLAGKRVMEGTAPQAVTPSQFGQRLLFEMDGVEWGWPQRGQRDFLLG
jgi:hypothetical protein